MRFLAYTLPDTVSPESMRHFLIVAGLVCIVLSVLTVRFVGRLVLRAWLAAALVALGFVLFVERAELAGCARSCSCEVLRVDVSVPACKPQEQ